MSSELKTGCAKAFEEVEGWVRKARGRPPFLLGIGGPGGCGKTTLSHWLLERLEGAALLPLDDFRFPREQRAKGIFGSHPDGNDVQLLRNCLNTARKGRPFERPVFDGATGRREKPVIVAPCSVLICDGEIAAHGSLRQEFDALVLIDAHWRTQLNARLTRDLQERGCSLEKAMEIFLQSNLRDYPTFARGAAEAAQFVLYRNSKGNFSTRKRPDGFSGESTGF